ncbi:MAG: aminotransferase class III-fold pyridoxal phosphate-dependent enzyme [Candidatus Omnitrophica bacterium]|nr:aminotransferase class III-fold pyridoxal phosphate-dependent enzyme [Candidatus Omnitrophota bacterium]
MGKGQRLYKRAKEIIPGGTQLLSKRPEMFLPDIWPAYYDRAKGCTIWDMDGKKYTDASYMGIGACILGYADKDVDRAVKNAVDKGSMATLNCPEEVELAETLCDIHPWAGMVRYARTGGEAMAIAVRIARAKRDKDLILFCGYHGWHDWYLAANLHDDKSLNGHLLPGLAPKGVPRALKGTALPFNYNGTESFLKLIRAHRENVAAVVMEPVRNHEPEEGFLETIREETKKSGIVLIFDEITAGFRLTAGGAHLKYGVNPDMAVFGKAMSNGYPMAAIIGRKEVMAAAQETFISSTYWTERIGPAAALATMRKIKKEKVTAHLNKIGRKVQDGWQAAADKNGLNIEISGIYPLGHFSFKYDKPLVLKTLFTQEMLKKGFLAVPAFYASYGHKEKDIDNYLEAVDDVFKAIAAIIRKGSPEKYLKGPVCHSGFKRLA